MMRYVEWWTRLAEHQERLAGWLVPNNLRSASSRIDHPRVSHGDARK